MIYVAASFAQFHALSLSLFLSRVKRMASGEANAEIVRCSVYWLLDKAASGWITRLNGPRQSRRRDRRSATRRARGNNETRREKERERERERDTVIGRSAWNLHRVIKLHARGRASGYVSILCQTMDDPGGIVRHACVYTLGPSMHRLLFHRDSY